MVLLGVCRSLEGRCPTLPFGSIYKEWFRYHDDEPNIEFGHFFTSPIRITSTGPETIAGILKAHKSLYEQGCSLLSGMDGAYSKIHLSPWPKPQQYKLLPLCRAIVVLIDQLAPSESPEPDGFVYVDKYAQRQSVIMIRTGDESCLRAPISFESIRGQSLSLDRSDINSTRRDRCCPSLPHHSREIRCRPPEKGRCCISICEGPLTGRYISRSVHSLWHQRDWTSCC